LDASKTVGFKAILCCKSSVNLGWMNFLLVKKLNDSTNNANMFEELRISVAHDPDVGAALAAFSRPFWGSLPDLRRSASLSPLAQRPTSPCPAPSDCLSIGLSLLWAVAISGCDRFS
jgi:hypothetical protein